jgi:hypothetical protein
MATSLCGTGQVGSPLFCGDVWKLQAGGALSLAPSGYRVDVCAGFPCAGESYSAFTDANGHWDTQAAVNGCQYGSNNHPWYIFVSSLDGWGSHDYPVQTINANNTCGLQHITTYVEPAPLRPQPISPSNNSLIYLTSVSLTWQNAIDAARNDPNWPAWYDLYVKSWPSGTTEPASYPEPTRVACAPESSSCSYAITLATSMNYKWKVNAYMDVTSSIVNPVTRPIVFTASSSYSLFSTPSGRPPGCCRF